MSISINKLDYMSKKKRRLVLKNKYSNSDIIIIDLYNLYCNIINFKKHKLFSRESFIHCINIISKTFSKNNIIFVTKKVFEIELEYIINFTKCNKNINYVIVEDYPEWKSQNRERDDYICLLLQYLYKRHQYNSYIISNDQFKNVHLILQDIKPMYLTIINNGTIQTKEMTVDDYEVYNKQLLHSSINRIAFDFF